LTNCRIDELPNCRIAESSNCEYRIIVISYYI